jgi:hypothetical protein
MKYPGLLMNCRREAPANPALFKIENLVLGARSEYNGFAGTGASSLGVLDYWSIRVLAKRKLTFDLNWSFHYSTTPSLQQTPARWKEYGNPLRG